MERKDLKVNVKVKDKDLQDLSGTIAECDDLHNVFVTFDNGGSGYYCFAEDCAHNNQDDLILN